MSTSAWVADRSTIWKPWSPASSSFQACFRPRIRTRRSETGASIFKGVVATHKGACPRRSDCPSPDGNDRSSRQMNTHVTASAMAERLIDVLRHRVGKDERAAKQHGWFNAAILTLRDDIIDSWMESTRRTYAESGKRVYYLSLEFLIGRLMRDALSNMGLTREM